MVAHRQGGWHQGRVTEATMTKLPRRRFLRLAAGAAVLPAVTRAARAQTYPARPVRFVVPFPPGGSADPIARVLGNRLSEIWGQPAVIENKGGGGGNLGAQVAATAAPDGYTIFLGGAFMAKNPFLYPGSSYDPITDLAPVAKVCEFINLMVVPNSSPVKSVREFIDYAKSNRGKITYGSSGVGADPHMSTELFQKLTGIQLTHVPYRGAGPALNDVIPGRLDVYFGTLPSTLPLARSGQVRALAVTSAKRSEFAPEIPTIAEAGVPGYEYSSWYGVYVPAKTPVDIVRKLYEDIVSSLAYPPLQQRLADIATSITPSSPAELAALLKSDMELWGPIIKAANIKGE
jgi:tripartite-type tricarboxylate transporter receptor subunit TctC